MTQGREDAARREGYEEGYARATRQADEHVTLRNALIRKLYHMLRDAKLLTPELIHEIERVLP